MKEEDKKLIGLIKGVVLNEQEEDPGDDDEVMNHLYKHYATEQALMHLRDSGASEGYVESLERPLESLSRDHYENAKKRYLEVGGNLEHWKRDYNSHMMVNHEAMSDLYNEIRNDEGYEEPRGGF